VKKPASEFNKDKNRPGGLQAWCKACKLEDYHQKKESYNEMRRARYTAAHQKKIKPKDNRLLYGAETLCVPCSNAIATRCEFMSNKDKEKGLAMMGVGKDDYIIRQVTGGADVYQIIRCPNFKAGPPPPLARRAN
jgi:hypothetical protein